MASGFLPQAVIQLHPTLACNLRCGHCYSRSGPGASRGGIPAATFLAALVPLRAEGYDVISISGGEPFAYRGLDELVLGAAATGWRVHLVTNGTLITPRRIERIAPHLSAVAVSLDGDEGAHNELRASPTAFADALRGMDVLRAAGVGFGVSMTVGRVTLDDVPAVYDHCAAHGAALLSLRPLAPLGRASEMDGVVLDHDGMARLFIAAQLLDGLDPNLRVRTDAAPAAWIAEGRANFDVPMVATDRPLADLVNPLVVDELGQLLPFAHGLDPRLSMGDIRDVDAAIAVVRRDGLRRVASLVERTFDHLPTDDGAFVDWYASVAHESHAAMERARRIPVASASA
jgi:hypothetical protein